MVSNDKWQKYSPAKDLIGLSRQKIQQKVE